MNLVEKNIKGKYGSSGVVVSQENNIYKVSLDNGLVKDFTYEKLLELFKIDDENKVIDNENKVIDNKYINKEFTNKSGQVCKIIKQITFDKVPSLCYYLVEFEDGIQAKFYYGTLLSGNFRKPINYIGMKFTSNKDNSKCKIIKQLTFDKTPSACYYLVEFEDGIQAKFIYNILKQGNFKKPVNHIGKEFTSTDGYKCKIIKRLTFDKALYLSFFLVEFDDGTQAKFNYSSLKCGAFKKPVKFINEEFISKEGVKCKVIEQLTFDKVPSKCIYKIKFENNYIKKIRYFLLKNKYGFSAIPSEFKHCNSKNVVDNKYYKCTCKLCNYTDFLTIDEMVEHLQTNHNLYNKE